MLQGGEAEEGWVSFAAVMGQELMRANGSEHFRQRWAGITAVLSGRAAAAASQWDAQGSWELCREQMIKTLEVA